MIKDKGLFFLALLISFSAFAEQTVEVAHPFKALGSEHLNAFTKKIIVKKEKEEEKKSFFSKMTGLDDPDFTVNQINDFDRYNLLFNEVFPAKKISNTNTVLSSVTWKDLELLCGDHIKTTTMLSRIDRTTTGFGHTYLSHMFTTPIDSIPTLTNRQAIVRTLIEEQELTDVIEQHLKEIREKESALLYFWKAEENKTNKMLLNGLYWEKTFTNLNESTTAQELRTQGGHVTNFITPFIMPGMIVYCLKQAGINLADLPKIASYIYNTSDLSSGEKLGGAMYGGFILGYQGLITKLIVDEQVRHCNLLNYLHEQTNGVAVVVRTLNKFEETFAKHPALQNLEYAQIITDITHENKVLSAKLKRLIALLKTNTFKGKQTIFSLKGRVRVAYHLLKEIKEEIVPALYAIGEIDAYLSTAKLYKEFADQKVGYNFVSYNVANKAHIVMKNMWNPFVPVNKVVENSITLGQSMPQNVILTGPNAGGKSTFLKGLTTSILMAQTLGIAPVKELSFTPFAKINTYMNITDDTAGGNSLFKSEVLRAQSLLETVKSLNSKNFSLSIMDEMFSGTSPKEGEAASYAVAKRLGEINNSILLLASHFPKLKNLESKTTNFKNYQVRVIRHNNGSFSYPFKLEEGAADQNVAIDILREQGFDSSILDDANALLNE